MTPHIDFLKANFGLIVLTFVALALHLSAVHAVHAGYADWLSWLEGKEGEILAAILTLIVGSKAANGRSTDRPPAAPPDPPKP